MKTELINYSRIPIHSFHVRNNPGKVGVYSQFEIKREKDRFISVHAIFHRWDNYFLKWLCKPQIFLKFLFIIIIIFFSFFFLLISLIFLSPLSLAIQKISSIHSTYTIIWEK